VATISHIKDNKGLTLSDYKYDTRKGGLPFEADFVVRFEIESNEKSTILHVYQSGFPSSTDADEFYAACDNGWTDVLNNIRSFLK
jgi:hypothetical protein